MSNTIKINKINVQVELQALATFNVKASASHFLTLSSLESTLDHLSEIQRYSKRLILGGGSNILFVGDYQGLVLFPQIFGIELLSENQDFYRVSVGASENWHDFVIYSNQQGWYGLENLALIPGTVGAAPIQNIGAYGIEVKKFIHQVECVDLNSGEKFLLDNQACCFGYRDSIFKQAGQGKYLVTRVELDLYKEPNLCLNYEPLKTEFSNKIDITAKQVLDRVCQLRQEKLPDPKVLPNAGSFFKNPVVSTAEFERLKASYPNIVAYPDVYLDEKGLSKKGFKLAAAWLIDQAGFKGYREGQIGVHEHQALVLVNYAEEAGDKIWCLAQKIQEVVKKKYQVVLEPEVRIEGSFRPISN